MKYSTREIGRLGEKIAEKFLISRKFRILNKNFSCPLGEIDIVARQDGHIIFVEVKTRTSNTFGFPLEAITIRKKKHILRNCFYYLKKYGLFDKPYRVDAIGIMLDTKGGLQTLTHIKNAIQDMTGY